MTMLSIILAIIGTIFFVNGVRVVTQSVPDFMLKHLGGGMDVCVGLVFYALAVFVWVIA